MKKLEKIEEGLNRFVLSIATLLSTMLKKLTPSSIKNLLATLQKKLTNFRLNSKKKAQTLKVSSIEKVLKTKEKLQNSSKKITAIPLAAATKAKDIKSSDMKWAKISAAFLAFFTPLMTKIKSWYLSLQPQTIAVGISFTALSTIAGLTIYTQVQKVAKTAEQAQKIAEEAARAPASAKRPAYFRKSEKQFAVANVILPAYFRTSPKELKKLVIDFTFESSNKYIRNYFDRNAHLIQDTLNTTIEPISINFPLEDEGKIIIKEKIKKEMNKKLRKLKVKGEIKEVYINSIIAG